MLGLEPEEPQRCLGMTQSKQGRWGSLLTWSLGKGWKSMMYFCLYVSCTETCGIKKIQISHIFRVLAPAKVSFKKILNSAAKIDCNMMVRSRTQKRNSEVEIVWPTTFTHSCNLKCTKFPKHRFMLALYYWQRGLSWKASISMGFRVTERTGILLTVPDWDS